MENDRALLGARMENDRALLGARMENAESYGRFAWIYDPDCNKIERWQPL